MISVITADVMRRWYRNNRNEYGRLKKDMKYKKSGSAPSKWSVVQKWRWSVWSFLFDLIQNRGGADDTMVGIYTLIYLVW